MILANQVRFTTPIKHTSGEVDDDIMITSVGFIKSNSIDSDVTVEVIPIVNAIIIFVARINVSSDGNYGMNGNVEIRANNNPEDVIVTLDIEPAMVTSQTSSQLNIIMPISFIGYSHLIPVSFIIQVEQAIKPPILFF